MKRIIMFTVLQITAAIAFSQQTSNEKKPVKDTVIVLQRDVVDTLKDIVVVFYGDDGALRHSTGVRLVTYQVYQMDSVVKVTGVKSVLTYVNIVVPTGKKDKKGNPTYNNQLFLLPEGLIYDVIYRGRKPLMPNSKTDFKSGGN